MTITELRRYEDEARRDRTDWLGEMVIFAVGDSLVPHTLLADKLRGGGLDQYIPPEPKDENVFRRVWSNRQRGTAATDEEGVTLNILIRELERRAGLIVKRVVIERVDVNGQSLGYEEVLEARFEEKNPHLVSIKVIGNHYPEAWELVNRLRDDYLTERGCVDGTAVRTILRDVMADCYATSMRGKSGGVYFVRNHHLTKVEALEAMGQIVPGAVINTVPIIDNEKQRANVKRAVESESQDDLDRLIGEMQEALRTDGEIHSRKAASFADAARKAKAKMRDYRELLEDGLDSVDVRLRNTDEILSKVVSRVAS